MDPKSELHVRCSPPDATPGQARPTGELNADDNPIYATPHHPVKPRRQRRPRFAEAVAATR